MVTKNISIEKKQFTRKTVLGVLILLLILSIPLSMIIWHLFDRNRFTEIVSQRYKISKPMIQLIRSQAEMRGIGYSYLDKTSSDERFRPELSTRKLKMDQLKTRLINHIHQNQLLVPQKEFNQWKKAVEEWETMYEKPLTGAIDPDDWLTAANKSIRAGKQIMLKMVSPYNSDEMLELLAVLKLEALEAADLIGVERAMVGSYLRKQEKKKYPLLLEQHGVTRGVVILLADTISIATLPESINTVIRDFNERFETVYGDLWQSIMDTIVSGQYEKPSFETWWEASTDVVNKALQIAETADQTMGIIVQQNRERVRQQFLIAVVTSAAAIGLFLVLLNWLLRSLKQHISSLDEARLALHEHKDALEKTVRERTSELQMIIDAAVDAIIVINERGTILEFNRAAEKMFGYQTRAMLGKNVNLLMPEPHRSNHDTYIQIYLETRKKGVVGTSRETTAIRKDGTQFPIRISVGEANIKDKVRFAAFIEDITERKKNEKALKESREQALMAVKARSMFLANMSHEIRTPMNSILGFIKIVLEDPHLPEGVAHHLEIANESARSLLSIINDILDMSKLDQGQVSLEKITLNLPHIVKESIASLQPVSRKNKNRVEFHYDGRLPHCFLGDPIRLKQVFINLIGNAVKFTQNGRVEIEVENAADRQGLSISIRDTGPGIPDDKIGQIFEQFSQADQSISRRYGGTGLGLTISRQLVAAMGGDIQIKNRTVKGTLVTIFLDLPYSKCVETCEIQSHTVEAPEKISPRVFNILLAEDVVQNAMLARIRLEEQRHTLTVAENGRKAVEAFKKEAFDVVLMDIHMPEMDGLKATELIREYEIDSGKRTPVIALTASVLPEDIGQCKAAGIDVVLPKPVDFIRLFSVMEEVVPKNQGHILSSVDVMIDEDIPEGLSGLETVINLKVALDRWGHHHAILMESLKTFAVNHARSGEKVRQAIEVKAFGPAFEINHKLKGVCGNLGIETVETVAEAISTIIKTKNPEEDGVYEELCRLADDLVITLEKVIQGLSVMDESPSEKKSAVLSAKVPAGTHQHIEQLKKMLKKAEIDEEIIQAMSRDLQNTPYYNDFKLIRGFIEGFDFEKAGAALDRLQKVLNPNNGLE